MVTLNKSFNISGKPPFDFLITGANATFSPNSGTINSNKLEFTIYLEDSVALANYHITLSTKEGCKEIFPFIVENPCASFGVNSNLLISYPNTISYPVNTLPIEKYEWNVGPNLNILSGQNTPYITVEEKLNSSSNSHLITCTVYSKQGCKHVNTVTYTTCNKNLNSFSLIGECGIGDIIVNGLTFLNKSYKKVVFNLQDKLGEACKGCSWDYSTFKMNTSSSFTYVATNGIVSVVDKSIDKNSTYGYSIKDSCGKEYFGTFTISDANCAAGIGCYILPKLQDVTINCNDINTSATNSSLVCGAIAGNPFYRFLSLPIYGNLDPTLFNWNTFKFVTPTNNGIPIVGYNLSPQGDCMQTPYGRVSLTSNYELEYIITTMPTTSVSIAETFEYRVIGKDNCISDVGSNIFLHSCVATPEVQNFSECISCNTGSILNLNSHIDLKGGTYSNLELDTTLLPTAISVTVNTNTREMTVNSGIIQGVYTLRYRVQASKYGILTWSEWKTITLEFACAGNATTIIVC